MATELLGRLPTPSGLATTHLSSSGCACPAAPSALGGGTSGWGCSRQGQSPALSVMFSRVRPALGRSGRGSGRWVFSGLTRCRPPRLARAAAGPRAQQVGRGSQHSHGCWVLCPARPVDAPSLTPCAALPGTVCGMVQGGSTPERGRLALSTGLLSFPALPRGVHSKVNNRPGSFSW